MPCANSTQIEKENTTETPEVPLTHCVESPSPPSSWWLTWTEPQGSENSHVHGYDLLQRKVMKQNQKRKKVQGSSPKEIGCKPPVRMRGPRRPGPGVQVSASASRQPGSSWGWTAECSRCAGLEPGPGGENMNPGFQANPCFSSAAAQAGCRARQLWSRARWWAQLPFLSILRVQIDPLKKQVHHARKLSAFKGQTLDFNKGSLAT